ncbi:MAG: flagellar protein export ATPase FliI [Hyphomicrobiales bacterium]|nr:flagellar protein export ATPase FliI [Hyphomicrobiales bacterium]
MSDLSLRNSPATSLHRLAEALDNCEAQQPKIRVGGFVSKISRTHLEVRGLSNRVKLWECVAIGDDDNRQLAQIILIDKQVVTVKPLDVHIQARLGTPVWHLGPMRIFPHASWKGRILNAVGEPIDGNPRLEKGKAAVSLDKLPPPAMKRKPPGSSLRTGVRVLDIFTPLCAGQRMGIFAGSGVGKSTLLAMLAKTPDFDSRIVCLVGERSREVREFLETTLGAVERTRTIAIVSTSDESPMMRRLAPLTAMSVAEYLRGKGERVLVIIDSITRFAHAAREIGIAAGEPPVARGYTPSVLTDLPRLLERAGPGMEGEGSITGFFSVLVDGDDHNDPIADCIRGTLDGHLVLDRMIADQGRYPAVNILASISRLAPKIWKEDHHKLVLQLRALIAQYEDTRDLRLMGGFQQGVDAESDLAIRLVPKIYELMNQTQSDPLSADAYQELAKALNSLRDQTPIKS